jgi:hypothetical protein
MLVTEIRIIGPPKYLKAATVNPAWRCAPAANRTEHEKIVITAGPAGLSPVHREKFFASFFQERRFFISEKTQQATFIRYAPAAPWRYRPYGFSSG